MYIDELQKEKDALEKRLQDIIGQELDGFAKKTGVSIEDVSVYLITVGEYGEKRKEYILGNVSCKIAF